MTSIQRKLKVDMVMAVDALDARIALALMGEPERGGVRLTRAGTRWSVRRRGWSATLDELPSDADGGRPVAAREAGCSCPGGNLRVALATGRACTALAATATLPVGNDELHRMAGEAARTRRPQRRDGLSVRVRTRKGVRQTLLECPGGEVVARVPPALVQAESPVPAAIYIRHPSDAVRAGQEWRCVRHAAAQGYKITDEVWDERGNHQIDWMVDDRMDGTDRWMVLVTIGAAELRLAARHLERAVADVAGMGCWAELLASDADGPPPEPGWLPKCREC